ncbi:MAG: methionine adenosyltransferase domain-containing protein [Candidatus Terrybacteria bacterium]|nr:methionine adenosyltransferase domain-containing protein [Candidatus Terrybacteria bacterium]
MRTAEAVRNGHPDKVCDIIADALLDAYLARDPNARVAIEVQGGHGKVTAAGEVTTREPISFTEMQGIIQQTYEDIGYQEKLRVETLIAEQSGEIAAGVDTGGAGDSGIVSGYATSETFSLLPKELALARALAQMIDDPSRRERFGPDGKTQVTLDDSGKVASVVVSAQHLGDLEAARQELRKIVAEVLGDDLREDATVYLNPAGLFTIGGFTADTGVSGRKIVQDQYGPNIPVGGGSFSGKDGTKVDRSGAYFARHLAVRLVRGHDITSAFVQMAYAIGVPRPVWTRIETEPKESAPKLSDTQATVTEIIETLGLRKPIFTERTKRGHFGFDGL